MTSIKPEYVYPVRHKKRTGRGQVRACSSNNKARKGQRSVVVREKFIEARVMECVLCKAGQDTVTMRTIPAWSAHSLRFVPILAVLYTTAPYT